MRVLLKVNIPVEAGNAAVKSGKLGSTIQSILEEQKPEAVYFSDDKGQRTGYLFLDLADASQIPAIAEPWMLAFNAAIELHPVMVPRRPRQGRKLAIEKAVKKYASVFLRPISNCTPLDLCDLWSSVANEDYWSPMSRRIAYYQVAPEGIKALQGIDPYFKSTNIEPRLRALVELRTSQINGCAYCVDLHSRQAREHGETQQRLDCLSVWRETTFYDDRERGRPRLGRVRHQRLAHRHPGRRLRRSEKAIQRKRSRRPHARHLSDERLEPHRDWFPPGPGETIVGQGFTRTNSTHTSFKLTDPSSNPVASQQRSVAYARRIQHSPATPRRNDRGPCRRHHRRLSASDEAAVSTPFLALLCRYRCCHDRSDRVVFTRRRVHWIRTKHLYLWHPSQRGRMLSSSRPRSKVNGKSRASFLKPP